MNDLFDSLNRKYPAEGIRKDSIDFAVSIFSLILLKPL